MKSTHKLGRRGLLGGVAAVGGAVAAASVLSAGKTERSEVAKVGEPKPEPSSGYQLSEHVKRYYATARV